ncbi:MAG: manganese-dependent inorganic pyrophosphatase, partial [Parcubacteria group bacterium]|nr:manganese-dependent inorganic pyrophosphatase [Parcubacteria group bacterium]
DYKDYDLNGKKLGCGVAETVTPEALLPRKSEFLAELKKLKDAKNLDYSYFIIVDILNSHADLLIIDTPEQQLAETVFGGSTKDNVLDIGGRISRKKQFIAPISEYLSKA